jgi:hypothetical protein
MSQLTEAQIFTKTIAYQDQANFSRLTLQSSPKLQKAIESRKQAILKANPAIEDNSDIFKILVQDLFNELKNNPSVLLLKHWSSFLCDLALAVSAEIFKIVGGQRIPSTRLLDIQSICVGSIGNPRYFFKGFDRKISNKNDLLHSLQAYSYRSIKFAAYPSIRKEFNDPNIGRSNLALFNHYSDAVVSEALLKIGLEPAMQNQYLALCRCAKEYLRQNNRKINQLQPDDFNQIGDLYQVITGYLPPPVRARLEEIGEAIRKSTSPLILSIDQPLSTSDDHNWTMADNIASSAPQPDEYAEIQELQSDWRNICDCWLEANIQTRDRQILYLRYHFDLKHKVIESIIGIDQPNISKRLRKIHLGLAQVLVKQINPESNTRTMEICKLVVEMLSKNFEQLSIADIDPEDRRTLAELIQAYREQADPDLLQKIRTILKQLWS